MIKNLRHAAVYLLNPAGCQSDYSCVSPYLLYLFLNVFVIDDMMLEKIDFRWKVSCPGSKKICKV